MSSKQLFDLTGQTEIINEGGSGLGQLMEANDAYVGRRRCKRCSMFTSDRGLREGCERNRSIRQTSTCPSIGVTDSESVV
ncbi:hypothetical protein BACCIP111899_04102 [Bacillus rhizoplanae]|uniref:Uncharacterized protein n=1 Tax=Bacillus rhizoplanae TaxID=2880966 RepID=A0ABM8YG89_9BACI|nr:hypothetical protein [Bacillus rhizoplanae]CAG9614869.1 hypothetical protein BACCIP111899_04102 [Bacillus rhizoplanae]